MTAIDMNQLATDCTDTWLDYNASSPNSFFALEDPPQIPFYDTPQSALFSGRTHKKVQINRRILEYRAKY